MVDLAQYTVGGLTAGTLYGLVGLGIVLLYRSSRVLNFAHGDIATLAAFLGFSLVLRLQGPVLVPLALEIPWWQFLSGMVASAAVTAALTAAFYFLVLRPVKEATLLGRIVVTLGLALVLNGLVTMFWGADTKIFPFPISDVRVLRIGGVVISHVGLALTAAGLTLGSSSTCWCSARAWGWRCAR